MKKVFILFFLLFTLSIHSFSVEENEIKKFIEKNHNKQFFLIIKLDPFFCEKCYHYFFEIIYQLKKNSTQKIEVLATLKCFRDIEVKNFIRKFDTKFKVIKFKKKNYLDIGLDLDHDIYLINSKLKLIYHSEFSNFSYDSVFKIINNK